MRFGVCAFVATAMLFVLPAGAPAVEQATGPTLVKHVPAGSINLSALVSGFASEAGGLAVDASGKLYLAFRNTSSKVEIAVLSPDGHLLNRWDPTGGNSVGNPTKLAIGPDGSVYVRNRNETLVRVYQPNGTFVRSFGDGTLSPNAFGDIEVDSGGNVYVISLDHILRFNPAGTVTGDFQPVAGVHSSDRLTGLAIAPDGSMYVGVDVRSNPTPAEKLPLLAHIDASGGRLADPAPLLHRLLGVAQNYGYVPADVDFTNGRLYITGSPTGLAVLSASGELLDSLGRSDRGDHQVAVRGDDAYTSGVAPTAALRVAQEADVLGHWHGDPVYGAGVGTDLEGCGAVSRARNLPGVPRVSQIIFPTPPSGCNVQVTNIGNPCPAGTTAKPLAVYINGREIPPEALIGYAYDAARDALGFKLPAAQINTGGDVLVDWLCENKNDPSSSEVRWEWKGRFTVLKDPSGNVIDAKTRRPIAGAVVRLQFSVNKSGPFGVPGVTGYSPQLNPQATGKNGFFGWDVANGYWRLKVTAFGYKPFTSAIYKVPPEVSGLKLRLKANPAQQRFVLEPGTGRAGNVRVGSRLRGARAAGLKIVRAKGKVRTILVRSKRYRTVAGVRLGTRALDLIAWYPARTSAATKRLLTSAKPVQHRVAKATFTVRRGRVVGIRLGR